MRTYVIGRDRHVDIVLDDPSVGNRHAELVVSDDARIYLTDCASGRGTWIKSAADGADGWQPLRQSFVQPEQELRFGDHLCTAQRLLQSHAETRRDPGENTVAPGGASERPRARLTGAVERDPTTGEIVRKRR